MELWWNKYFVAGKSLHMWLCVLDLSKDALQGKELWWNEYGVGGGASQDGNTPAKTAVQTAATPFFGIFGPYVKARDPWQTPQVQDYNHYFYRQTLAYLDSRGVSL